jgi:hypothetical protein
MVVALSVVVTNPLHAEGQFVSVLNPLYVHQRTVPNCAEEEDVSYPMEWDNGVITMRTRILDRSFKYVPACQTNIRRTFVRIRQEQKVEADHIRKEQQTKVSILRPTQ